MPEEVKLKEIERARWFLERRQQLKTALILVLIILNIVLWGNNIYQIVRYFKGEKEYEEMLKELTVDRPELQFLREKNQPEEILILKEFSLPQKTKYDYLALVENPNERWFVKELEYYFISSRGETEPQKTYLLPKSKKYLKALAAGQEPSVNLFIKNISWQKIKPEQRKLLEILPQIKVFNQKFSFIELQTGGKLPQISFELINESVYSFWEINLDIAFFGGQKLLDFETLPLVKFLSGETRKVEFIWSGYGGEVPSHLEIRPEINVLDEGAFISPKLF